MAQDQCVFVRGFRAKYVLFRIRSIGIEADSFGWENHRGDKMQVIRVSSVREVGCVFVLCEVMKKE